MRKPDFIISYHTNPAMCGVAKFNKLLGEKLNIPVRPFWEDYWGYPLLSIKPSEFSFGDECELIERLHRIDAYQLFLHSYDRGLPDGLIRKADKVYAANHKIAHSLMDIRCDVISAWCPSLIEEFDPWTAPEISVFSFGMAHKIQAEHYAKLDRELQETGKSYELLLSTAFHEGFDVESEFGEAAREIRKVFTGSVHFLGCLSDESVQLYLKISDYFAAFFPDGFRENNTSINAAREAGIKIITNCDEYSPGRLEKDENGISVLKSRYYHSWKELIDLMEGKNEVDIYADRPCDVDVG